MKTEELIALLAADASTDSSPRRSLWRWMFAPVVAAALILILTAGVRADMPSAITTPRLGFKFVLVILLAIAAGGVVLRLARPGARAGGWARMLFAPLGLLLTGVVVELSLLPGASWGASLRGQNALWCLRMIPLLAALPLAGCLLALKRAAPTRATQAGAAAGLFSAAIGAALYALHCTDDSPLFVATWYTLATGGVTVIGAVLGARILRW